VAQERKVRQHVQAASGKWNPIEVVESEKPIYIRWAYILVERVDAVQLALNETAARQLLGS
jgi:hypothetical protein